MDHRVQTAMAMMEGFWDHELSLGKVAQAVNLSPSHLRNLFKAETGVPPARYLKSLRMLEAKELMETTFLNVKQVMNKVGVSDKGQFAKDFRKAFGLAPTQYRVQLINTHLTVIDKSPTK
jgi:transcriptional regulator GlxA family with amidase domain